ncbi:hypothetical protein GCM10018966_005780 [Streptomyces yanii]
MPPLAAAHFTGWNGRWNLRMFRDWELHRTIYSAGRESNSDTKGGSCASRPGEFRRAAGLLAQDCKNGRVSRWAYGGGIRVCSGVYASE